MPRIVYARARAGQVLPFDRATVGVLARRLDPDNIDSRAPLVEAHEGTLTAVLNPTPAVRLHHGSVCMGSLLDGAATWSTFGASSPDGSFALVRNDAEGTELLSDVLGCYTIWYVQTDDLFIASTSQRAIVMLLGSYEPNADAIAWQLSSGSLGPGFSWDARIRALPPASRLTFDHVKWRSELVRERPEFTAMRRDQEAHLRALAAAIEATFAALSLDLRHWVLPLSGGYDSRMILLMLKDRPALRTITWGLRDAIHDRRSDAFIAQALAAKLEVPHRYFDIDLQRDRAEQVLERFVRLGEGRTDRLGGYTDGFAVWRKLYREQVSGVIRGDEAFGCRAVSGARQVYANTHCTVLADFAPSSVQRLRDLLPEQRRPAELERRDGESIASWRDRVNAEFEFPYVLAPLNDLKLGYLDVAHPLLSRRIVQEVRRLPDRLRTNKAAFKRIVERMPVGVPIATRTAIALGEDALRAPAFGRAVTLGLAGVGRDTGTVYKLAGEALERLARERPGKPARHGAMPAAARLLSRARRWMTGAPLERRLPALKLAFRTYIVARMQALLADDAVSLAAARTPAHAGALETASRPSSRLRGSYDETAGAILCRDDRDAAPAVRLADDEDRILL